MPISDALKLKAEFERTRKAFEFPRFEPNLEHFERRSTSLPTNVSIVLSPIYFHLLPIKDSQTGSPVRVADFCASLELRNGAYFVVHVYKYDRDSFASFDSSGQEI